MNSCWSCLVVIENGANVCPLCGADQTPPPPLSPGEVAILSSDSRPAILRWILPAGAILLSALGAAIWYTTRTNDGDAPAKAESAATSALMSVRVALSQYATSHGDQYPSTLEPLGAGAAVPAQDAQIGGYALEYKAPPSGDGKIEGFTLVAQPGNASGRSFYIDQSGVLRATKENRPARADDPPA
jgi:type II secretory pathway pseudopilin PulG